MNRSSQTLGLDDLPYVAAKFTLGEVSPEEMQQIADAVLSSGTYFDECLEIVD